ncbi:MAG: hypothetical protein ABSB58_07055 [Gemmatimonadales bacterium]|jgi:uncharacterized repeat protein (TIGR01451 family)
MKTHAWRIARVLVLAAFAAFAAVHVAQAQTPEGTVITNTATASFTDANTNTYSNVSASVSITVGFAPGVDVTGVASVTPASPSSADTLSFPIQNIGNGTDSLSVSENISVAGVITVTGYRYGSTTYASLALLNAALSAVPVAQSASITVKIVYNVNAGEGGVATNYSLTAASRRHPATTDVQVTTITPVQTRAVAVTPDGAQNLQQLPTNGAAAYSFTYSVVNNGNGPESFNLLSSHPGAAITIVTVNGVAGSSTTIGPLAAGASQNIAVTYTLGNVAAGTKDTLVLKATAAGDGSKFDTGFADLTVVRPSLAITKAAYLDDQVTLVSGTVLPGQYVQYKVTVTNNGAAAATSVSVTDAIPAQLTYISNTNVGGAWSSINYAAGTVTATLSGSLAPAGSATFWLRVQVK